MFHGMTPCGTFTIRQSNLGPYIEMRGGTIVTKAECSPEQWQERPDGKRVTLWY